MKKISARILVDLLVRKLLVGIRDRIFCIVKEFFLLSLTRSETLIYKQLKSFCGLYISFSTCFSSLAKFRISLLMFTLEAW